jgi:carbamoylphosphate synthase small subunit
VDDITRLFEVGNILILKQEINFSGNPYSISENILDTAKPSEETTAFSEVKQESLVTTVTKKDNRNKTNNNTQINNATNKNKYLVEATEISKISLGMKNNIPSELAFFNIKLMLKGSYVNYVRARNALTRVIPSANIVLEEVVITKAKKDVEIRIVIDIPYKKY